MILPKNQNGFTLVELLIGLVAASIVSYAAMSLYITSHKEMIVQDQVADLQGNVRASAEMMASAIRKAGYNVPGILTSLESTDSNPDTIVVTYDASVLRGCLLESDMLDFVGNLDCSGHDLSRLKAEDWLYIYDRDVDFGEFFQVTDVNYASSQILRGGASLSRAYPRGSDIIKMTRIRFFIDQTDSTQPNLMIQAFGDAPQVLGENIIGLNFRYFLENGSIVTQIALPEDVRMVEIDVLGRASDHDDQFVDNYRTRNFSLRVKVRNLDLQFNL